MKAAPPATAMTVVGVLGNSELINVLDFCVTCFSHNVLLKCR